MNGAKNIKIEEDTSLFFTDSSIIEYDLQWDYNTKILSFSYLIFIIDEKDPDLLNEYEKQFEIKKIKDFKPFFVNFITLLNTTLIKTSLLDRWEFVKNKRKKAQQIIFDNVNNKNTLFYSLLNKGLEPESNYLTDFSFIKKGKFKRIKRIKLSKEEMYKEVGIKSPLEIFSVLPKFTKQIDAVPPIESLHKFINSLSELNYHSTKNIKFKIVKSFNWCGSALQRRELFKLLKGNNIIAKNTSFNIFTKAFSGKELNENLNIRFLLKHGDDPNKKLLFYLIYKLAELEFIPEEDIITKSRHYYTRLERIFVDSNGNPLLHLKNSKWPSESGNDSLPTLPVHHELIDKVIKELL